MTAVPGFAPPASDLRANVHPSDLRSSLTQLVAPSQILAGGAVTGQTLKWNGSQWVPGAAFSLYDITTYGAATSETRANNTIYIQNAINAAAAVGGTLLVPAGTYQYNTLYWVDGVNAFGEHGPYSSGSVLDGHNIFATSTGTETDFYGHAKFWNIKFTNGSSTATGTTFKITKQIGNVYYDNCYFGGNYTASAPAYQVDRTGASAGTVERIHFNECVFDDCEYGFWMDGGTSTTQEYSKSTFQDCQFNNYRLDAVYIRCEFVKTLCFLGETVFEGYTGSGGARRAIHIEAETTGLTLGTIFEENSGSRSNGGSGYYSIEIKGITFSGTPHNNISGSWTGGGNIGAYQGASRHADCTGSLQIADHNAGFLIVGVFDNQTGSSIGTNVTPVGCYPFTTSNAMAIQTKVKAGIPSDSDVPTAATGMAVLDTTNNRIYFRVGSTWKYAALT